MSTSDNDVGRLPQQFGKFGECLVMFWLGRTLNYTVALVDHEGADIIASGDKRYAVSVKSRTFDNRNERIAFDNDNQKKLRNFADKFGCVPAIAFVFVDKSGRYIDVCFVELDEMTRLSNESDICFKPRKDGNGIRLHHNTPDRQKHLPTIVKHHIRFTTEQSLYHKNDIVKGDK